MDPEKKKNSVKLLYSASAYALTCKHYPDIYPNDLMRALQQPLVDVPPATLLPSLSVNWAVIDGESMITQSYPQTLWKEGLEWLETILTLLNRDDISPNVLEHLFYQVQQDSAVDACLPYLIEYLMNMKHGVNVQSSECVRKLTFTMAWLQNPRIPSLHLYLFRVLPKLVSILVCDIVSYQNEEEDQIRSLAADCLVSIAYSRPEVRRQLEALFRAKCATKKCEHPMAMIPAQPPFDANARCAMCNQKFTQATTSEEKPLLHAWLPFIGCMHLVHRNCVNRDVNRCPVTLSTATIRACELGLERLSQLKS